MCQENADARQNENSCCNIQHRTGPKAHPMLKICTVRLVGDRPRHFAHRSRAQNARMENYSFELRVKNRGGIIMDDRITYCPKCGKRRVPVFTLFGRTDLQCITCDDPAVKWAESPVIAPEKPIVAEPVQPTVAGTQS
jgi:hypothetical protein